MMGGKWGPGAVALGCVVVLGACAPASTLRLRRVVLHQNGVGYFERSGQLEGDELALRLAAHEVDDVLTTLTVVDPEDERAAAPSPSVAVPPPAEGEEEEGARTLTVALEERRGRELLVAYAAPTPVWRATYRVVLPEEGDEEGALLQAWAVVYNASAEDWTDVELALATSSPFSFRVDLRSRRFGARPDASGRFARGTQTGPVVSTASRGAGRDGDGVPDADDLCPDEPEDIDAFEDQDGCPDPDNDQDRILDVDDQCPNDPETYNGVEDQDGCPDRGRVTLESSQIVILEKIYFEAGSAAIPERSGPILDAIAATLQGNPQIRRIAIEGHTAPGEARGWVTSAERAGAIRAALIERGVAAERLRARALADTQPVDQRDDEDARARNRRVEFRILERAGAEREEEEEQGPRRVAVRPGRVAGASDAASNLPRAADGATHYGVARHVDIPAGASSLVTILSRRVPGAEVLLFRPDASARGSDRHPLRAVRIENATEVDLVGGPVSLFARGAFVGEGLLEPLAAGRVAFVPFAVDGATEVEVEAEVEETPARILALSRGRLQVERTRTRTTRYRVRAGEHAPPRLFVQHARAAGYAPVDLPPETEDAGAALLVPLPLTPGRASELAVAERTAVTGSVALLAQRDVDLRPYLEGSALEEGDRQRLGRVLGLRDRLVELAASEDSLQTRLADVAQRSAELRASITALRDTGARGRDTRRTLVARLEEAVAAAERLATELAEQRAERLEAEATLRELVTDWEIAPPE